MLYGHGNHVLGINKNIRVDFSSNIWYGSLNNELLTYLQSTLIKITDYPTVDAFDLQCKVAKHYKINDSHVCITSGATEAFYLISHAFQKCSSSILHPSFSEYADAARMYQHKVDYLTNEAIDSSTKFSTDLVWIGNPNNPDGKIISLDVIENLLQRNNNSTFIIDEAYGELCADFQSAVELLASFGNLIIVKSVTKLCSIPGLRLGYILANSDLIKKIASCRMPWSVSTLALEAGVYIFNHYNKFLLDTQKISKECKTFQTQLNLLEGLIVCSSNTNYFLLELKNRLAADLKQFLIDEEGFLIRDCANFYGLSERHFRLAIQGDKNNTACVKAISNFLLK